MEIEMTVKEKLQEIFREVLELDDLEIYDEMTAQDVEGWDSLAQMELVITAEKEFHIKFTTKEISELKNVGEFIDMIEKNMIKR